MEKKNPIQVADRLFLVLETLAKIGPSGLSDLSKLLDLNKSTLHRILDSLISMGYAKQDSINLKYSLSFKIWEVANHLVSKIDMIDVFKPFLKDLMTQAGETVHLVQIDEDYAIYIDKVESYSNSIRMMSKVGKTIPLYCSAVGKALLSERKDNEILDIWNRSDIKKLTNYTILDSNTFLSEIKTIRKQGYALDNQENEEGVRCIAACVKDYRGGTNYAFSISAPLGRMDDHKISLLVPLMLDTQKKLLSVIT